MALIQEGALIEALRRVVRLAHQAHLSDVGWRKCDQYPCRMVVRVLEQGMAVGDDGEAVRPHTDEGCWCKPTVTHSSP